MKLVRINGTQFVRWCGDGGDYYTIHPEWFTVVLQYGVETTVPHCLFIALQQRMIVLNWFWLTNDEIATIDALLKSNMLFALKCTTIQEHLMQTIVKVKDLEAMLLYLAVHEINIPYFADEYNAVTQAR